MWSGLARITTEKSLLAAGFGAAPVMTKVCQCHNRLLPQDMKNSSDEIVAGPGPAGTAGHRDGRPGGRRPRARRRVPRSGDAAARAPDPGADPPAPVAARPATITARHT